jgi:uncharacterized Rmd1/YagE family protein
VTPPPEAPAPPRVPARAWALGERIDVRQLERGETLALSPLTLRVGRGFALVFRFGAVAFVDVDTVEQASFAEKMAPFVSGRFDEPATEAAEIAIDPERGDGVDATGLIQVRDLGVERLQVIASVLAKSAVLGHYEGRVSNVFDRIEDLATQLGRGGRPARNLDLLRELGSVLLIQARTVGRVEVTEKPETTWDRPELDRFYEKLSVEYELRERDLALSRKLDLVARTAETYLDLLSNRQSIRVEWYIVLLILVEIVLSLYEMFVR